MCKIWHTVFKQIKLNQMEAWISNSSMCEYLGVSRNTLYKMRKKLLFTKGTHWRNKDPLNPLSHKVWKRSAVDQMLSQPTNVLKRRTKKV